MTFVRPRATGIENVPNEQMMDDSRETRQTTTQVANESLLRLVDELAPIESSERLI